MDTQFMSSPKVGSPHRVICSIVGSNAILLWFDIMPLKANVEVYKLSTNLMGQYCLH